MVFITPEDDPADQLSSPRGLERLGIQIDSNAYDEEKTEMILHFVREHNLLKDITIFLGDLRKEGATEIDYSFIVAFCQSVKMNPSIASFVVNVSFSSVVGGTHLRDLSSFLLHTSNAVTGIQLDNNWTNRFSLEDVKLFKEVVNSMSKLQSTELVYCFCPTSSFYSYHLEASTMELYRMLTPAPSADMELEISFHEVHMSGARSLGEYLAQYPELGRIFLDFVGEAQVGESEQVALATAIKYARYVKLNGHFGGKALKELLSDNLSIKTLVLFTWGEVSDRVRHISEGLMQNNTLVELDARFYNDDDGCDISALSKAVVSSGAPLEKMRLKLEGHRVSNQSLDALSKLISDSFCSLKSLDLDLYKGTAVPLLAALAAKNSKLENLDIRVSKEEDCVKCITILKSVLPKLSSLIHLGLSLGSARSYRRSWDGSSVAQAKATLLQGMSANTSLESFRFWGGLPTEDKVFQHQLRQLCELNKVRKKVRKAAPLFDDELVKLAALPHFLGSIQEPFQPQDIGSSRKNGLRRFVVEEVAQDRAPSSPRHSSSEAKFRASAIYDCLRHFGKISFIQSSSERACPARA